MKTVLAAFADKDTFELMKLDGIAEAAQEMLDGINADDAAKYLRMLGFSIDDVGKKLEEFGYKNDDTNQAIKLLGANGLKSTSKLEDAFAGLAAKIGISTSALGTLTGVLAGVAVAYVGIRLYNQHIEELVDNAREAASVWSDQNDSLNAQTTRIKELREALDSGTLSEEESYKAKSELLQIQKDLTDSYGDLAKGITLANAALDEQSKLIASNEANEFLNENSKAIKVATKKMTENIGHVYGRGSYIGAYNTLEEDSELIDEILSKYGEYISLIDTDDDPITQEVYFYGNAEEAKDVLNNLLSDFRSVSKDMEDASLLDSLTKYTTRSLEKANDILSEYQDIYNQARKATLVADTEDYSFGDQEKTAYEWLNDYAKAIDEYNVALVGGDPTEIATAAENFNAVDSAIRSLTGQGGSMAQYSDMFGDVSDQLDRFAIAQNAFASALVNETSIAGMNLSLLAEGMRGLSDIDLKYALETDGLQEGEDYFRAMIDLAKAMGFVTGDSAEEVQVLIDLLIKLGYVSGTTSEGLVGIPKQLQEAFYLASKKTDDFLSDFGKVTEVLNQQSTGTSISLADYSSSELKDYTSALEYNNGALKLNADKVNELIKAKAEEQIAYNNTQKAIAQTEYIKNARDISKLNKEIKELEALGDNLSDDQKDLLERNKQNLVALENQNESILETCTKYSLMSASIREATGAYQHWLNAQSASQSGDMFDDTLEAINHINNTLNNNKSEFYGRVGRSDYTAALDVIIPDNIDKEDEAAVNEYMAKISNLFMYDEDGVYSGLNIGSFLEQAKSLGLMDFDEVTKTYNLAGEMTIEAFADGMGLALPLVQAMFGELGEYGGDFGFLDYGVKTIGDLAVAAENAANALESTGLDIDLNFNSISDANKALEKLTDESWRVKLNPDELSQANDIIEYCVIYKQQLEDPLIMKIDKAQLSKDQAEAIGLLEDFKTAYNSLVLQQKVGADTTLAEAEVEELRQKIASSENDYLIQFGFDTTSKEVLDEQIRMLAEKDIEKLLKMTVDDSLFIDYVKSTEFDQPGTVIYDVDDKLVKQFARDLPDLHRTVYYKAKNIGDDSGTGQLNGTAHLSGTAYLGGNWGTAPGGKTLTGELGREIVVTKTGRWYTVGDHGAQFVDIPKGSVVFNHVQTEQLLKNGYVGSRAHALMSGTAMLGGTSMRIGSGISENAAIDIAGTKGLFTYDKVKPIGTTNRGGSSSSISKSDLKVFDWIEVAIERIGDAIDRLTDVASSAYKSLKSKLTASADAITLVTEQIKVQKVAYEQYMEAANSVGLSDNLKAKVQNGSIDLAQYDEDTQKLIEKYQEFYDKAQDSKKAVDDLHEELADLYSERFDNIQEDYNNQLEDLEHLTAMYESELSESRNVDDSKVYDALRDIETQKIELLTEELNDLRVAFQEAIDTGLIEVGSQAWHDMRNEIHGVNEELAQTKEQLVNLYVEEFEEIQDDFDNKTEALDHAATQIQNEIDLLEAKGYKATQEHYEALQDVERERIKILKNELSDLEKTLADGLESGEISEGDDDWYDMKSAIEDTKEEIQEANIALEEYNQTMREMDWEAFDKQQKALSDTIEETNFQLDLLDGQDMVDESGNITSVGSQAAGYHSQNYNAYMKQADAYAKEIQRIDAELANDPNNDLLLERREELLEMQRESILAAKDEKDAIADINEEIADKRAEAMEEAAEKAKEAAEKEAEAMKEALDKELEAMKKLVDSYTDALDKAKDLHDYRKKIADQTEAIGDIEKQLSAYNGDDSEETRATVQKLKDDLKAAKEDLKETEYDKYVSDQKQMLDDMYSQYEENINARIDQIDAKLEATINSIDSGFSSSTDTLNGSMLDGFASLLGGITSSGSDLGGLITDEIQSSTDTSVDSINGTISEYGDSINEDVANSLEVLEQIRDNTAGMIAAGDQKEDIDVPELERGDPSDVPTINDDPPKTEQNSNQDKQENPSGDKPITVGSKINAGNALIYEYAGDTTGLHQYFDEDPIYTVLKEQNGYLQVRHHTATSGIDGWFKKNDVKAYRTGGLVDYDGLAMVHGGKKPELFLNPEDTENFMALTEALREMKKSHSELMVGTGFNFGSDFAAPYVSNLVDIAPMMSSLRDRTFSDTSSSFGDIQINIPIEHVDDYNDFIRQLKTDKKLEQIIQDMTIGRIASKNSLAKHLR